MQISASLRIHHLLHIGTISSFTYVFFISGLENGGKGTLWCYSEQFMMMMVHPVSRGPARPEIPEPFPGSGGQPVEPRPTAPNGYHRGTCVPPEGHARRWNCELATQFQRFHPSLVQTAWLSLVTRDVGHVYTQSAMEIGKVRSIVDAIWKTSSYVLIAFPLQTALNPPK